jgi:gluconokinase
MPAVVVMGVSGCGKSSLGRSIAKAMSWRFVEGDDCHTAENINKMRAGIPLTDADRLPFLEKVAGVLQEFNEDGVVVSCSALKRSYRDQLRESCPLLYFIWPKVKRETLAARMEKRLNEGRHFMPLNLLDSQLETLESPEKEGRVLTLLGEDSKTTNVGKAINYLQHYT